MGRKKSQTVKIDRCQICCYVHLERTGPMCQACQVRSQFHCFKISNARICQDDGQRCVQQCMKVSQ